MKKRRFSYIRIKEEPKKRSKKNDKVWKNIGHAMTVVGTTISSMLLILVVMLCIVATVIVVYILDFANTNSWDLDLKTTENKFTTIVYAYDSEDQEVELKRLASTENRIWISYEDISPNIINAVVAKEDKRFYMHKGVDWQRTVFALVADVLDLTDGGRQGGSTITQQLIKNITEDKEQTWERKLREIFRALSLEERYTKEDILESYLNKIPFGGKIYGVEAACQGYFGKSASEVTIAEAAIIAGIIKKPDEYRPTRNLTECRNSQLVALYAMYEQGFISYREYEAAKAEQVKFVPIVYGDAFGYTDPRSIPSDEPDDPDTPKEPEPEYEAYKWDGYEVSQNWYVDAAIRQVIEDYADLMGITYTSAKTKLYNGGFKIYTNMNIELQNIVEEKYRDPYLVVKRYNKETKSEHLLQSAFVLMDYSGTVVALAGALGDKMGDNCFNRATMALRSPGSTMKPISTYSMAMQNNIINYSQLIPDKGIPIYGSDKLWPTNAGGTVTNSLIHAWYAVRWSRNTVPVRLSSMITPQVLYNHLTQNLGISSLYETDIDLAPMTLGALTYGVSLLELTAAYQIFGNGGTYYEPRLYSRVVDSKNNVILEQNFYGNQAIDSDTAWVINRMLKTVVTEPSGQNLGRYAKLGQCEVVGKTGTSNDNDNLLFIGLTPNYVGSVWLGRDDSSALDDLNSYDKRWHPEIWHDVMASIEDVNKKQEFTADPQVVEMKFCTESGLLATTACSSTDIGYYRQSNIPGYCSGDHDAEKQKIWDFWNAYDDELRAKLKQH